MRIACWPLMALPLLAQVNEDRLRADLTFLASEALEGRLSLRPGSEVAVQWIAAEFAKAALKPAAGSTFLQPVPLIEYRTDSANSWLVVERNGARQRHPVNGGFPDDVSLRASVVFAGFGITAPEFGYDDYAGIDVRGKIVLVFDHEPQENDPKSVFNGIGNTRHANSRWKALNAQNHGAAALLVVPEPVRKHPSNAERTARIPDPTGRRRRLPTQVLAGSPVRIPTLTVTEALAKDLLAATGKSPADLQNAIDAALRPASRAIGGATIDLRIVNAERRRGISHNVIGVLEGSDPALRRESVIFSGHSDHDGAHDGNIYHGADDNGSGTVGVVELARVFAQTGARPKRTLVFAVFAAEERGLLGSYHYAAHPLLPLDGTRAVINFDMIGRNETASAQTDGLMEIAADTSNELNLIGTINSPQYRDAVESANREIGLRLNYKWDRDAALNIFQRSDQFPFALHDIPAVWWFTGFHPDYHQTTDTVERINFPKMARILNLAYRAGLQFADATPPRYQARP